VLELRLDGGRLYLDGQVRHHTDADRIAAGLRQRGGLTVDPPRTQNLRDAGVGFTLTAAIPQRSDPPASTPPSDPPEPSSPAGAVAEATR
jgi:hypothetical protein